MKKCPYCAEDIQDGAIKCKHCGSDLAQSKTGGISQANPMAQTDEQAKEVSKNSSNKDIDNKKAIKWVGIVVAGLLGLIFWYIAIPVIVIWYLYKKNTKFNNTTKLAISVGVSVLFLILGSIFLHDGRTPTISIISPDNSHSVQASSTDIVGSIDPYNAELTINGIPVETDESGGFTYQAQLVNESNQFTIIAKNNSKEVNQLITVTREFTEEEIAEREARTEQASIEREEKRVAEAKEKLQREIDSIRSGFDGSEYRDNVLSLQIEVALFSNWAKIIKDYQNYKNDEVVALANELEREVSALQVREFPLIRKNYAETLAKTMWENNVKVTSLGGAHKTIQFTAGMFANNANKAEVQRTISETLQAFRFTRANYKWYEYDDEFTYYTMESLPDSEVAVIR